MIVEYIEQRRLRGCKMPNGDESYGESVPSILSHHSSLSPTPKTSCDLVEREAVDFEGGQH